MKTISYSLLNEENKSDAYYSEVALFTDIVLEEAEKSIEKIAEEFQFFLIRNKSKELRSRSEYVFELLTLGTLLRIYENNASSLGKIPQKILSGLVYLRKNFSWSKPFVDPVRGILSTLFLTGKSTTVFSRSNVGVGKVENLILWLDAAGEFKQEVIRLKPWIDYFSSLPVEKAINQIYDSIRFAKWFENKSLAVLGKYTQKVEFFLEYTHTDYKWSEDYIFCGRKRVEYHLNLVGAEIMNRAWQDEFLKTKHKAVLVPACMRAKSKLRCKAFFNGIDYSCDHCTAGCKVNQLTKFGEKNGFDVFMIPHSTDFTKWLKRRAGNKDSGIVGVTCALNLMTGGWEAKSLEIPINCVPLDYCGCKNHWDKKGFPTDINITELKRKLKLKSADELVEK